MLVAADALVRRCDCFYYKIVSGSRVAVLMRASGVSTARRRPSAALRLRFYATSYAEKIHEGRDGPLAALPKPRRL